jgi:hypothetical protein
MMPFTRLTEADLAASAERRELKKADLARARAYPFLGITAEEVAVAPQITPQLREIARTIRRAGQPKRIRRNKIVNSGVDSTTQTTVSVTIDDEHAAPYGPGADLPRSWPHYLSSDDHADARKVLLAYHSIPHYCRDVLPIEAFCVAAKVSPLSILGILVGSIVRMGAAARTVIAMVNQPRVVQKSVEMALTDDGIADRELLAKATGFLPTPKGAQTIVNVAANANAAATAQSASAPPPEQTVRTLVDLFNEARGLPPASAHILPVAEADTIPERMPYEDDERVPVDADDSADDPNDVRTI